MKFFSIAILVLFLFASCSQNIVKKKTIKEKIITNKGKKDKIINEELKVMARYCNQGRVSVCKKLNNDIENIIINNKLENYLKSRIEDMNDAFKLWELGFLLRYRKVSEANSYYFFKKSCKLKNMDSCKELALMYLSSYGYITYSADRDIFFNSCDKSYQTCSNEMARLYLLEACEKNDSISCSYLGYINKFRDMNMEKARSNFKKSCDLNDSYGCLLYSSLFYPSVKKDVINILKKSCSLGNPHACYNIIEMIYRKILIYNDKKIQKYISIIEHACNLDDSISCSKLGNLYVSFARIIKTNIIKAKNYYEKACKMDDLEACNNLAYYVYENSDKNYYKARDTYYKACSMNFALSCMHLGFLYSYDYFEDSDFIQAYRYHLKTCNLDTRLCNSLGDFYIKKYNNEEFALNLYFKACSWGVGKSCLNIAKIYKKNKKEFNTILNKSVKLLDLECEKFKLNSCMELAREYKRGEILEKSESKSKKYYLKACKLGNLNSCKIINYY